MKVNEAYEMRKNTLWKHVTVWKHRILQQRGTSVHGNPSRMILENSFSLADNV